MHDLLAYLAIIISLVAVSMKNMLAFRILHFMASLLYVVYGIKINSNPIAIGGILFGLIHIYRVGESYFMSRKSPNKPDRNVGG